MPALEKFNLTMGNPTFKRNNKVTKANDPYKCKCGHSRDMHDLDGCRVISLLNDKCECRSFGRG